MVDTPLPSASRRRLTLVLVVAAFVAPIVGAWWLAMIDPPRERAGLLNHGTLLVPPIDVRGDAAYAVLDRLALGPGEWAMILYGAGPCAEECQRRLTMLTTIRSLLGHDGTRLEVAALLDAGELQLPLVTTLVDATARRKLAARVAADGGGTEGIVFFDWRGQIMLHFTPTAPPGDIKADIKRLLRATKL